MLLTFICGWSASDRTRVAGAAASRDVRVILTAVTLIVSRQAAVLWTLSSTGRQQRYGPYRFQAGNSVSRSYSESEVVRNRGVAEYSGRSLNL